MGILGLCGSRLGEFATGAQVEHRSRPLYYGLVFSVALSPMSSRKQIAVPPRATNMNLIDDSHPLFERAWRHLLDNHENPTALISELYFRYREQYFSKNLERRISFLVVEKDNPILGGEFDILKDQYGERTMDATDSPGAVIYGRGVAPALRRGAEGIFRRHVAELFEKFQPAKLKFVDQLCDGGMSFLTRWALDAGGTIESTFNQVVDLNEDEASLWRGLSKSCQWGVNWGRKNLLVKIADETTNDWALQELRRLHFEAAGLKTRNDATWDLQKEMLASNEAFIVTGAMDGKVVSASLFQQSAGHCYYAVSATDRHLFEKPISHVLIWEALKHAKGLGCSHLALGSQVWANSHWHLKSPTQKEVNISKFKRSFGGITTTELGVTLNPPFVPGSDRTFDESEIVPLKEVLTEALSKPEWSQGARITLRPLVPADVTDRYLGWFADETVTVFLDVNAISRKEATDYIEQGVTTNEYFMCAVCDRVTGIHIGNVKIGPIRWLHKTSDLVTVIGDRAFWGKGFATEAIQIGMRVAFHVLQIRKLHGSIDESNIGSLRAYTRAGWIVEGRLRDHLLIQGKASSSILVCAFNPAVAS
jgi:ribosomal-protein-alanine N-acetyltransferase